MVLAPAAAQAQDGGLDGGAPDAGPAAPTDPLCPLDHVGCVADDVDWEYRDALFDDVMTDTGWVPPGSPIQMRFAFAFGGSTEIDMGGTVLGYWPPPLGILIHGRPGTGRLAINYGLELIVQLRFDIEIAGIRYNWTGDIPVPGIPEDLRLFEETVFDPFALPPSMRPVSVSDTTDNVRVLRYDALGGLIPVPGVGGGLALTVQVELNAAYQTDRIMVNGGPAIETENGVTMVGPDVGERELLGAKDVVAHPEGQLFYDGTIWFRPGLYLSFAGTRRDFPLAEIPVPIMRDREVVFDDETAHLPLPDIEVDPLEVELGAVTVGGMAERIVDVHNRGERTLEVTVEEDTAPFAAAPATLSLPPSSSGRLSILYMPDAVGMDETPLHLATNDPDEPLVELRLTGTGLEPEDAGAPPMPTTDAGMPMGDAGTVMPPASKDGGCGCRASSGRQRFAGAGLALLLGLVLARRRRREG